MMGLDDNSQKKPFPSQLPSQSKGQGGVILPFSPALQAGDFIFVSGQVGFDADKRLVTGGIEAETAQCLDNINKILAEYGAGLADIVKCTVWLDDARDFAAFNRVYSAAFGDRKPARSTVESRLMIDAKVEIDAIAYFPHRQSQNHGA